eukprot:XP_011679774.1 PREDICTED: uncharacterized protein LOC105445665 [Strongylocentrotus purpuratus]
METSSGADTRGDEAKMAHSRSSLAVWVTPPQWSITIPPAPPQPPQPSYRWEVPSPPETTPLVRTGQQRGGVKEQPGRGPHGGVGTGPEFYKCWSRELSQTKSDVVCLHAVMLILFLLNISFFSSAFIPSRLCLILALALRSGNVSRVLAVQLQMLDATQDQE